MAAALLSLPSAGQAATTVLIEAGQRRRPPPLNCPADRVALYSELLLDVPHVAAATTAAVLATRFDGLPSHGRANIGLKAKDWKKLRRDDDDGRRERWSRCDLNDLVAHCPMRHVATRFLCR